MSDIIPDFADLDAVAAELADPLMARQFELEAEMIEDGRHRYWDRVADARPGTDAEGRYREGEESRAPTAQCLLRASLNPVRQGIVEFLETARKGRPHVAIAHLKMVDSETAAFLALKGCLDAFSLNLSQTNLCLRLGRSIEDEVRLRAFEDKASGLLRAIRERFATSNFSHQRRVLNALAQRHSVDLGKPWEKAEALHVGSALLTFVLERTGLFELVTEAYSPNAEARVFVRPTAETLEWVRKRDGVAQFLFPTYMPTVVKPRAWTGPRDGGYHFGLARKLRLVKNRSRGYQASLRDWDMPVVYRAVNALQETPWSVNPDVLRYLSPAAKAGIELGGLPETRQDEVPPAPADIPQAKEDRTPEQQERLVAWKSKARGIYEANLERRQKGLAVARTVAIAERYAEEDRFYFPYTLDFRGRAYPATSFLQPQGCDYQKALLRFADGKPLGEQGACWLAVHGANLMAECPTTGAKLDKLPLQARIDWVFANEARIVAVAADPDASDWWTQGDSPWQFLAFCIEWAGYVREGAAFVSHLPVALDGSCNGLQHFSAMLRDEVGGSAVNLVPHELPADIYMEVCRKTVARLEVDAMAFEGEDAGKLARLWLDSGQVDRTLCKRPVMTMPYGSKQFGIRDQIIQELRKRGHGFKDPETGETVNDWKVCGYLAAVIWEALGTVVVKAREAMDWLQACAKLMANSALPINWVSPAGFWVQQDYKETYTKRVKTQVAGQLLWPRLEEDGDKTAKARQQSGVAPNFVHSMDAAAMMLCIEACLDAGVTSFAMIHDSYGTHAADTEVLAECIRGSFIAMYEGDDVLGAFRAQLDSDIKSRGEDTDLPAPPGRGELDLGLVARSDFFFA